MRLVSLLGGLASAGLILLGLSISSSEEIVAPDGEVFDAHQVVMPVEMPPPPTEEPEIVEMATLANPIRLEIAESAASPVHITVPDLPALDVDQAPPVARPEIQARFDLARSAVRPVIDTGDLEAKRIFDRGQVDQPPMAIQRPTPKIGYKKAREVEPPRRTIMLLVVNTDGTVGDVRVVRSAKDAEFDAIMVAAIREWKFSPAIRKGKKVRCWVQQSIAVSLSAGSPFITN
jgi:TonB family protein